MQKAYVNAVYNLIKEDKNVLLCLTDSGTDYEALLKREFPSQCLNFGISENNQVGIASGLALNGKIPFVYTTNAFLSYRSYEFIRDDVCFQKRNVKFIGMGSGLTWSTLGSTHHAIEDIGVLRSIPNLIILSPASPIELEQSIYATYKIIGPVFIRSGMSKETEIYDENYKFELEKNVIIKDGKDLTIFVTGNIIRNVIIACEKLKLINNIDAKIVNVHTLKPFYDSEVLSSIKKQKLIVSVEEHSIIGGLGSIISETMSNIEHKSRLLRIGLPNEFIEYYGIYDELISKCGLDSDSIYNKILEEYKKK